MPKQHQFSLFLVCLLSLGVIESRSQLTTPPNGGNKKASVSERIGLTDVTITYNRPGVKGREGKIWGQLVAFGFHDPGFGTSKAAPWRAGANENTVIELSRDVKIEGQDLAAGTYGFHLAAGADECTLIFSRNSTSWGSYFYDEKEDALRVKVKPVMQNNTVEWLKYEFLDQTDNSATIALLWEKWKVPFTVKVDLLKDQLETFRKELRTEKGFTWNAWQQAAQFCADSNTNLEEGLVWAEASISRPYISEKNFTTLATKAQLLARLNRKPEADAVMKEALTLGKQNEIHAYARQMLGQKMVKEAFNAFKLNYDKHPRDFTSNVGMTRGYSALGEFKKALVHAQKALALAPDETNKTNVESMIKKLKESKDVN